MLVIDTLGMGGVERYVVTVGNRWAEQGVEVTVISERGEQVERIHPLVRHVDGPYDEVRATLPRAAMHLQPIIPQTRPDCIITNSLATALVARTARASRTHCERLAWRACRPPHPSGPADGTGRSRCGGIPRCEEPSRGRRLVGINGDGGAQWH
ncbi:MAG TPA: hypothetical protein DFR83_00855 [Deltaproteobacteria bacterium]|nr:hypothetical protein [Deltaproteobacteria bacterium]